MWVISNRIPRRHHHVHGQHGHHVHRHTNVVGTRTSGTREVKVISRVPDANKIVAAQLRQLFRENQVFMLNMIGSPGSGKAAILEKTLARIMPALTCAVIVDDACSAIDAERLTRSGASVVQINTDKSGGGHLVAHLVEKATVELDLGAIDLLVVESIRNLTGPPGLDIGEDKRIVVLSVTDGEDKPAKYPSMFSKCQATLLNKIDLLPHLDYDMEKARASIAAIDPEMSVFALSAKTEAGFDAWIDWVGEKVKEKISHQGYHEHSCENAL